MTTETKVIDKPEVDAFIEEARGRISRKQQLREQNSNAEHNRPDEAFFRKLDSSLKKNTAFIKKLKTLTESQRAALINDFGALNLTKYVEEMASRYVFVEICVRYRPNRWNRLRYCCFYIKIFVESRLLLIIFHCCWYFVSPLFLLLKVRK